MLRCFNLTPQPHTRLRLLKKVLNFVFLRVGAVRLYRPRAKNEKRQKYHKLDVCGTFTIPPSAINRTHLPLHKGGIIWILYFGVFQELLQV